MDLEEEIKRSIEELDKERSRIDEKVLDLDRSILKFSNWAWGFVWIGFVITIGGIVLYLCKNTESGYGLNLLGDFMAGTVASVWSLAGLFFIFVAFLGQKQQLLLQQIEIKYSQLEVKHTRLELRGQKEEMRIQNETLRVQKFENTFFQMLTLLNSIVNSLDLRDSKTRHIVCSGRDCFKVFNKRLIDLLKAKVSAKRSAVKVARKLSDITIEEAIIEYDKFYSENQSNLSHYFRSIYHILKFIDNSEVRNKGQYIAFTRAQLSSYEQIILFYNCLHQNGSQKFKPLIEKYSFFKNLDQSLIVNPRHSEAYKNTAFGKRRTNDLG